MARPPQHHTTRLRQLGRPAPAAEPDAVRQLRREYEAKTRRLEETLATLDNLLAPQDWLDAGDGFAGFGAWRVNRAVNRTQDRTRAPLTYLNEEEWRQHVALARDLCTRNHLALGFRDHVSNFVGPVQISFVLKGQAPGASASGPADADGDGRADVDPLVAECTRVWDEWCDLAEWGRGEEDREEECRRRLIVEGETTLRFFPGDRASDGLPHARHVEPELIRTPPGHTTIGHWGWGVRTADGDDECELGLWLCDPADVTAGRVVEADEYVRIKANVDRTVRRGLSDLFPVGEHLRKILGLLDNMAHVARLQAAIAWWEEYPTATAEQVINQIRQGADYQRPKLPPGQPGSSTDVTSYEAGTVVRTEQGRGVKPGPVSTGSDAFARVEQLVLRGVGFRWGCPSYFSGDSDESFASVLVTGSPFVRITESRQNKVKAFALRVAARVLELSERSGRLPAGTARRVKPVGTCKPVVIADEEKKARTFLSLFEKNCADPIEYVRSTGQDPAVVAANITAWKKKFPDGGGAPPAPPAPGPTATPPGSAGGDGSSPNPGAIFGEGLVREGFTGTITDTAGHTRHYVDGKQVAAPQPPAAPAGATGSDPARPAAPGDWKGHPAAVRIASGLEASDLPAELKVRYAAAMGTVLARIPPAGLDRIAKHLGGGAVFHPSTADIGAAIVEAWATRPGTTPEQQEKTRRDNAAMLAKKIGGAYIGGGLNQLHVDGDHALGAAQPGRYAGGAVVPAAGIHAHEMGHAIDGPAFEISKSAEWQEAYRAEIEVSAEDLKARVRPRLSLYGGTQSKEGLAEFARLVYGSDVPHAQIARDFPRATAVFRGRGLWPTDERVAGRGFEPAGMPEAFSERVALDDGASHADVLKAPSKESRESLFEDAGFTTKQITVHRTDGTTFHQTRRVRTADAAGPDAPEPRDVELHDADRAAIESGIDRAAAELPDAPPAGLVARAKDLALTAAARAYIWAIKLTPAALKVGAVLGEILDVPADLKKFAYNPTAAGGQEHGGLGANDFVKTGLANTLGVGVSGHLVATVAAQVLSRALVWAQNRLAGAATEAVAGDGVAVWAEMLAQLYAHLGPALGADGPVPDAAAIEGGLRALLAGQV